MIIGIDGNEANVSNRVGVGRYAYELLLQLKNQISKIKEQRVKCIVYLKDIPRTDLPEGTVEWNYKIVGPKRFWTQIGLPLQLLTASKKPEIFFTPSHYAPRFSSCPTVISIMDLSYIYYPEMFNKHDLYQLVHWTKYSVKNAKKILTISESTKKDIIKHYGKDAEDIIVTYPGYDRDKFKISNDKLQINKVKSKYNINDNYILYVGTLQPRKNIVRLIEAFAAIVKDEKIMSKNAELQLVIGGKKGWLYDQIFESSKKLGVNERIVFTDFIDDDDLPALYNGALMYVLPSLYEGFGIPVVEAMACGCPVVVSHVSSLPEIVGDAGLLVDPTDTEDIAYAIKRLLLEDKLKKDLVEKGFKQIQKFSWDICGEKTLEVLTHV